MRCERCRADAVGGLIVADGVAKHMHGGHAPVPRRGQLWQRLRRRLGR